jgi:hypothetical protein
MHGWMYTKIESARIENSDEKGDIDVNYCNGNFLGIDDLSFISFNS